MIIQVGLGESRHVSYYFGSRIVLAFLGLAGVVAFSGVDSFPLLVCTPAFGFFVPRVFLKRMIKKRQQRIRIALPDALDLTVICVEGGLALDRSMARVSEELRHAHPDLSEEFYLVHLDLRAGCSWDGALCNLSERTGNGEISKLVGTCGPLEVIRVWPRRPGKAFLTS